MVDPTPGALTARRAERDVVLHDGSAAGELSACAARVGLVERDDLRVIAVSGPAPAVGSLARRLCGAPLGVGGSRERAGAWWSRPVAGRLLIHCPTALAERVERLVRAELAHRPSLVADCRRDSHALLGVIGRCALPLVSALDADRGNLDKVAATWLLESDESAIACVPAARRAEATAAIERAGRRFGIVRVGEEAFALWAVGERQRGRLAR